MLRELIVQDLLLLERAELRLADGLNVLTGETGAGKTMLAYALDLLLGGKARSGIVRIGAAESYVEGIFAAPGWLARSLPAELAERLPPGGEELVLGRRVWPDGRSRAYVGGRAATVADLREIGGRLMSFLGQHEHRRLTLSTAQLEILDAVCGSVQAARRERMQSLHCEVLGLGTRLGELRTRAGARERELDLLAFELDEIETAAPDPVEAAELASERDRLRHQDALRDAAAAGAEAASPEAGVGAADLLAAAARRIEPFRALDPALGALGERLAGLAEEARDAGGELRRHAIELDGSPGRLEEVEERLSVLARLERKYGGSIEAVLDHVAECRRRRDELEGAETALASVEGELARAVAERDAVAAELRAARQRAAPKLAAAVVGRLADLAMPGARFEIALAPREGGCGRRGADTVEMLLAANAGVPATALRETASGGELSRTMLALLGAAAGNRPGSGRLGPGQAPLLVFDEVDAGIGGHTARAVGEHLKDLASGRQVLCITHLPQVAAHAERHFRIEKATVGGDTRTTVTQLAGDGVVGELVRMLGAGKDDDAANLHARRLLEAA